MEIRPFKAFRYDEGVSGDVAKCVAPPYDVIDEALQSDLYDRSDCNVVRVIKGKASDSDSKTDNVYSRAAASFNQWVDSGALKTDAVPAIYAYVQNFQIEGADYQRSGFVALGKLSEFGKGVQPHEKTLDGPKADRLNLMRATAAQFGQIFMLYDDPKMVADNIIAKSAAKPSLMDFCDDNDVRHRLFAVDDPDDVTAVAVMMNDKHPVIADGHHRYETALNYYYETQNPDAQFRMMTFVNMRNEGLVVLATHRLVGNLAKFDIDELTAELAGNFEITEFAFQSDADKRAAEDKMFASMKEDFTEHKNSFGIYAGNGKFYKALLKDASVMDEVCEGASRAAKGLDVNILHSLILDRHLGIGEKELAAQSNIAYIKDIGPAVGKSIAKVDSGEKQAVFFMNPTKVEQIRDVAAAGEKMPQKSTFFYPKVFTGLVINKL